MSKQARFLGPRVALVLTGLLVCATAWAAPDANCPNGLFVEAAFVPTGGSTVAVAVARIDSDSFLDIVSVNANQETVSVVLGNGDGTFGAPIVTSLNTSSLISLAVGDLDGDTNADLVIGSSYELFVLLGHGDGTFDAPVEYSAGQGPLVGVVLGKFDANSSLDIAAVSGYTGNVEVLLGNGDGTFAPAVPYSTGGGAAGMASADFNEDGHLDLAVSIGDSIAILLGAGDGSFGPANSFVAGGSLSGIAAADMDSDSHVDLVVSTETFVSVLLGNGDGTFQAALQYPTGVAPGSVAVADFDLDGSLDAVVASASQFGNPGSFAMLRGLGDGSLAPSETYLAGTVSNGLAVGDLDGDGLPDVVTGNSADQSVSVVLDMASGTFYAAPLSAILRFPTSTAFAQVDFNEDGRKDFAWIWSYSSIEVVFGNPHGRFREGLILSDPNSQQIAGVAAADFNSDGHADLVLSDFSNVWLYPGNGDGTFGSPQALLNSSGLGPIQLGDFDGNGTIDIALSQNCCGPLAIVVLPNNGDGSFGPPAQTAFATEARLILAADLTGDGRTDLVADTNGSAVLLPGNGDGTFGTAGPLESGQGPYAAVSADFDSNGHADLLLSNQTASVELFLAGGSGVLQAPIIIGVGGSAGALAAADFDEDGNVDFAVQTSKTLVLRGLGNGHFQSPLAFLTGLSPFFLAAGDYDANGRPDLANVSGNAITTLLNAGLGATTPPAVSVIIGSPAVLTASVGGGFGTFAYQWRKDGQPLSDGGSISGATTTTLTIDPVSFGDAGSYDLSVTDSCSSIFSNAATLSVEFADVPVSSPFHADILAIATAGITGGCGAGNYCPASPVRRDQMAVFLLKSEHGSGYTPPACSGVFADVPCPGPFTDWVEQLATEGITGGCGNGNYCPDSNVTRAQMAVFLLKTKNGSAYTPPPAIGIFGDVPVGSFAADFIENLYNLGITGGCQASPLLYCPNNPVLRQQMATFLVRTFAP